MKKNIGIGLSIFAMFFAGCSKEDNLAEGEKTVAKTDGEIHLCTEMELLDDNNKNTSKINGAVITSKKWDVGQIVRIKFLNGDSFLQEKVKQFANEWMIYANLTFQYVQSNEEADVKIAFKWNGDSRSWSYFGKDCQIFSQNTPTMNFGWFNSTTSDTEFSRTIKHEFGHLLGLVHEHQNPTGNIQWNKPKVYAYYAQQGWSTTDVDNNIFKKYTTSETNYSSYDGYSIMHYSIDASLTTDGYSVGWNNILSIRDKFFISTTYSYPIRSSLKSGETLFSGTYLSSPNGRYFLKMEPNGSLVIFDNDSSTAIWKTRIISNMPTHPFVYTSTCTLDLDGNLVLRLWQYYANTNSIYWKSNTSGNIGAVLNMQDDGKLVVSLNGVEKWSSN